MVLSTKNQFWFLSYFNNFISLVQNHFSRKIKVFQSDGGTEFFNNTCCNFFEDNGTLHRLSCPYMPQQSGKLNTSIVILLKHDLLCCSMHMFCPHIGWMLLLLLFSSSIVFLLKCLIIIHHFSLFTHKCHLIEISKHLAAKYIHI